MRGIDWKQLHSRAIQFFWLLFFVTLPVTSFPLFPGDVGGRTLVRPLSIYPLAVLLVLLTIPRLFRRRLPKTSLPLIAFVLIALISTVFAFTSDLDAFRGVTPISRSVRNLATLALGLAFYFTTMLLHETWEDLSRSLRWLYLGLGIALLWGTIQIPIVLFNPHGYFKLINTIQSFISTRKLFTTRISGMTFEPKWFAEQICFLLLPWLITSVLTNRSSFKFRWKRVTVEWVMLLWAVVVLLFTYSRTGMFILALLVIVAYIIFRSRSRLNPNARRRAPHRRLLEIMGIVLVLLTVFVVVGAQNPYFSRLWRYWTEARSRNRTYLEFIAVEQRLVYLETALHIFDTAPWLGVGLGNYAFYFDEALPNHPWHVQMEIVRQITPVEGRDRLITPKNLPARLIAETGVLGTGAFLAFLLAIAGCALYLWYSPSGEQQFWGLASFLALIVFAFIVFSFDSFALPNMWVVFGLISSAAHLPDPAENAPSLNTG